MFVISLHGAKTVWIIDQLVSVAHSDFSVAKGFVVDTNFKQLRSVQISLLHFRLKRKSIVRSRILFGSNENKRNLLKRTGRPKICSHFQNCSLEDLLKKMSTL